MSIQGAMNAALSSLSLLQQQSNLIANNIANANTPGYVQRDLPQLELVAGGRGAGVVAAPVQRLADEAAAATANQANGAQAYSQRMVDVLQPYIQVVGQAADSTSLPSMLSAFGDALATLSATPSDTTAQTQSVNAAQNLVNTIHSLDAALQDARQQADAGIASDVADVNATLDQLAQNERGLKQAAARGDSIAPFADTRDQLLASLSNDLPVKVFHDKNNGIIVTTDQGTTLWDGEAHKLDFSATSSIPSNVRAEADPSRGLVGGLSSVTVEGQPIRMSQGGEIAAGLQLRDVMLPGFSDQLDHLAGRLIGAFQDADPSVTAGKSGVFTAGGSALDTTDPAANAGLAGSIAVNASVDPAQGGQAWRMRDGAQATTQGPASDNTMILDFIGALQRPESGAVSLDNTASQLAGSQQAALSTWASRNTDRTQQAQAAQTALANKTGVNIDEQMQRLMIVQQSYQASAQVIQTTSGMLNDLLQAIR